MEFESDRNVASIGGKLSANGSIAACRPNAPNGLALFAGSRDPLLRYIKRQRIPAVAWRSLNNRFLVDLLASRDAQLLIETAQVTLNPDTA